MHRDCYHCIHHYDEWCTPQEWIFLQLTERNCTISPFSEVPFIRESWSASF